MRAAQKISCFINVLKASTIGPKPILVKVGNLPQNIALFPLIDNIIRNNVPDLSQKKKNPRNINTLSPFFIDRRTIKTDKKNYKIYGELHSGNTGIDSDILEPQGLTPVFNRKINHIEVVPLNFVIDASPGNSNIIIATQSLGVYGVTKPFINFLLRELRPILLQEKYHLDQENITMNSTQIKQYISDGEIKEIVATDFTPRKNLSSGTSKTTTCELRLFPTMRGGIFSNNINKMVLNRDKDGLITEIKSLSGVDLIAFSELKCAVKTGKTQRLINVFEDDKNALKFDLSHLKRKQGSCHPETKIIRDEIDKIIEEMRTFIQ